MERLPLQLLDFLRHFDLLGKARLSCQIVCDHDISVKPLMTKENQPAWDSTGPAPEPTVTPEAAWFPKSQLEREAPPAQQS